ncbi:hypothetical protein QYE76_003100 [Lolium multiflorum]|uniref:Uncharacterized protein n=1 Tax=Lolium multiflorum TaxID=4521 RepID=A0AAD8VYJ0_LOLMU|nr:hypothetical protein QYE76_003100 [Lolium multiflorum]
MVKKKGSAAVVGIASSSTIAKATADAAKRAAPEASPGDWPASAMSKRDEKKEHGLGLISPEEGNAILPAPVKASAQPPKRPSGGFTDEYDLLDFDEGFIEPPSKKAKDSPSRPTPAASKASVPPTAAAAQPSSASSLSNGKEVPLVAAISPSHHEEPGIQTAITILKGFASQFSSLQDDRSWLQEEVQSNSSKLNQAVTMAATARQNADSLKKGAQSLKKKLKEEEQGKAEAHAQRKEREDLLQKSTLALLEATDIPSSSVGKLPDGSSVDAIALGIQSGDLVRALL